MMESDWFTIKQIEDLWPESLDSWALGSEVYEELVRCVENRDWVRVNELIQTEAPKRMNQEIEELENEAERLRDEAAGIEGRIMEIEAELKGLRLHGPDNRKWMDLIANLSGSWDPANCEGQLPLFEFSPTTP